MTGWKINRVSPTSSRLDRFRHELITNDQGGDPLYLHTDIPFQSGMNEEVWKFSHRKWSSMQFSSLYAAMVDDEVASIAGCRLYPGETSILRMGMFYYTLMRYRSTVRSPLWACPGFITAAVDDHPDVSVGAVTIYPHNTKLERWCDALRRQTRYGQIGSGENIDVLSSFTLSSQTVMISGVPQYVLWKPLGGTPIYEAAILDQMRDK